MQTVYEVFTQKRDEVLHHVPPKELLGILCGFIDPQLNKGTKHSELQSMFSMVDKLFLTRAEFSFLVEDMPFGNIAEVFQNNAIRKGEYGLKYYNEDTSYVLISFDKANQYYAIYFLDMVHEDYIIEILQEHERELLKELYEDL